MSNDKKSNIYLVYINNIYINIKLFKNLKKYEIGVYNIIKTSLRFLIELFIFYNIPSKNN